MKTTSAHSDEENEKITTWADGFGIWHARVTFPEPGYDSTKLASHDRSRIRTRARLAIRSEIQQRQGEQRFTVSVEVVESDQDDDGVTRSITYRERVPATQE